MLILAIICIPILLAFIAGVAIGRSGREVLKRELAHLTGQYSTLKTAYEDMSRLAHQAIEVAREKHFPAKAQRDMGDAFSDLGDSLQNFNKALYHADPDPYQVKNCPACAVSVRASEWPQECPACHSLFGFLEV